MAALNATLPGQHGPHNQPESIFANHPIPIKTLAKFAMFAKFAKFANIYAIRS